MASETKRYYHYPEDGDVIRACPPYRQVEGNVEVAVLSIAEAEALKRLRDAVEDDAPLIDERFAMMAHTAYCVAYRQHRGEDYWTKGDYSKLNETYRGYDRSMVQVVLAAYRAALRAAMEAKR